MLQTTTSTMEKASWLQPQTVPLPERACASWPPGSLVSLDELVAAPLSQIPPAECGMSSCDRLGAEWKRWTTVVGLRTENTHTHPDTHIPLVS